MGQVESSVAGAVDQGEPLFPASQPDSHAAASTTSSMESLIAGSYLYFPLSIYYIIKVFLCDSWHTSTKQLWISRVSLNSLGIELMLHQISFVCKGFESCFFS